MNIYNMPLWVSCPKVARTCNIRTHTQHTHTYAYTYTHTYCNIRKNQNLGIMYNATSQKKKNLAIMRLAKTWLIHLTHHEWLTITRALFFGLVIFLSRRVTLWQTYTKQRKTATWLMNTRAFRPPPFFLAFFCLGVPRAVASKKNERLNTHYIALYAVN